MKLAAFGWPPGWLEKGFKQGFFYDGVTDTIAAKSPNISSIVKVGPGVYDVTAEVESDTFILPSMITCADQNIPAPRLYATQVISFIPPYSFVTRFTTYDLAGAPADAQIAFLQFVFPEHWILI